MKSFFEDFQKSEQPKNLLFLFFNGIIAAKVIQSREKQLTKNMQTDKFLRFEITSSSKKQSIK